MDNEKEIVWTGDMGFMPPMVKTEGRIICRHECQLTEYKAEIERLREALKQIEYLDRPQSRGQPRRVSIHEIALAALKGDE